MDKIRVLFVCKHNSARSQMAEAFLNEFGGGRFIAESAGLEPGELNKLVVKAMEGEGLDISGNKTKSVFDLLKLNKEYDYVITVCDESSGQKCPIFPGKSTRLHWSFPDPADLTGSEEEKLNEIYKIRNSIKEKVIQFIEENDCYFKKNKNISNN